MSQVQWPSMAEKLEFLALPGRPRVADGRDERSMNDDTPERVHPDHGCNVHPSCLECPLPFCVYDRFTGSSSTRHVTVARDANIYRLRQEGRTISEVASLTRLTVRSIQRSLRRSEEARG